MKYLSAQNKKLPFKPERRAVRFETVLPVEIGNLHGLARNISATGIYFETEAAPALGSHVYFAVELTVRGEKLKLVCDGKVLRVDYKDGVQGVAAKLDGSFFSNPADLIELGSGWAQHSH
ncbi:MAG: PilZ domain-containing protein [Gammaproteobacteria bacterium]|nr:PilZ domain-containing protein [Gammaproteobacteria bacterium]MBU4113167.1 PilZ domain-containing protein [Gammaproteobacteria bacterium]MBU4169727.1 PilZ domain-containing protein [Gammaproteobacteria bacterium]